MSKENNRQNAISEEQLLNLIGLYFDGQTTLEQEQQLRYALASTTSTLTEVIEAKAVLGAVGVIAPEAVSTVIVQRPTHLWLRVASIALAVAVSAALTVFLFNRLDGVELPAHTSDPSTFHDTHAGECFAYIGDKRIDDNHQVMNIISSQLADMGKYADDFDRELALPDEFAFDPE